MFRFVFIGVVWQLSFRSPAVGSELKGFRSAIYETIKEVRPKPEFSLIEQFEAKVPTVKAEFDLKTKATLITKYIFDDWKISADDSYEARDQKDNILPDAVLKTKRGHCVGQSPNTKSWSYINRV